MSLRRFEASSTPAALDAVRAALGPEAIILSNRQLDGRVEIIAAGVIDDALLALASDLPTAASAPDLEPVVEPSPVLEPVPDRLPESIVEPFVATDARSVDADADLRGGTHAPAPRVASQALSTSPVVPAHEAIAIVGSLPVRRVAGLVRGARPASPDPLSLPGHQTPAPWHLTPASPGKSLATPVTRRIASGAAVKHADLAATVLPTHEPSLDAGGLERVEARLRRLEVGLWGSCDEARAALLARLLSMGLGSAFALRLTEHASGESAEAIVHSAFQTLQASLPTVRDTTLERPGLTLLAGPDARARSDAMMKFATQQIAASGPSSLAFVCAHTERSGVFDALEAQGRELGVVTVRARDATELAGALDSFGDRPLVLADTGAELPRDLIVVRQAAVRRLLVLPATLQRGAARSAVASARMAQADGCVLMRLTAPALAGEVLDALIGEDLPIAWWSDVDARQMPLQRATAARIVATAVALAKKLDRGDDDAALATLLQPGHAHASVRFPGAVQLGGCAVSATPAVSTISNGA